MLVVHVRMSTSIGFSSSATTAKLPPSNIASCAPWIQTCAFAGAGADRGSTTGGTMMLHADASCGTAIAARTSPRIARRTRSSSGIVAAVSIARGGGFIVLVGCGGAREAPPPASPPLVGPERTVVDAPVLPPAPPPPMRLADDPQNVGPIYDGDAGSFVAPAGAFAVRRSEDGDQDSITLSKSVFACAKENGSVYVKIKTKPALEIVDTDAKPAVAACVLAQLAHDRSWRVNDPVEIDVVLKRR